MAKLLSGTRIYGNAIVDTTLTINGNVASNSTTSGTLIVRGGASVGGNIYLTGNLIGNVSGGTVSSTVPYAVVAQKPSANLVFTGDVTGSGNVQLTNSNTNTLSIALTVQPNSVALGTDTTGNYVDRVVGGSGVSVTGTADEGNVLTASLTSTGVVASTYGNATIIPVITVDAQGRITSASNVTVSASGGTTDYNVLTNKPAANIILSGDATGTANAVLTANSTVLSLSATLASTGVVATTYGNARIIPSFTVDDKGRITTASNITFASDVANVVLTGDVTGSANAILGPNSTTISISTTVAPNSVALGTDTTGNYTDRVVGGTGISATGTADEGNVITVGLTTTGVSAGTYGNANSVSQITVDTQGRITSASNVAINQVFVLLSGNTISACSLTNHPSINTNTFNFFAGFCAGRSIADGYNNIAFGCNAGIAVSSGFNNNFFGTSAGRCTTTGSNNNFIGANAGYYNTFGLINNVMGVNAGFYNTTGDSNNFFGNAAGYKNTTGQSNNFFGRCAGTANTTGSCNDFLGRCTGRFNTTGSRNIYLGFFAGANVVTGNDNIIFGCLNSNTGFTDATGNTIVFATGGIQRFCNSGDLANTTITGNIIAGGSGTFFGDGGGITGINYCNVTVNKPAANIILSGDATGTANSILTAGSTVLSLAATLASTGVSATTYGNARIIPSFTVDAKGRLTSASNVAFASDVANIVLTGDVTGSANVVLGPNSTTISIATTVAADSVALGTDTTGSYTARVVPGSAITVSGTADEGNVITISHLDTSSVANVSSDNSNGVVIQDVTIGFDTYGHVVSASVATTDLDSRYLRLSGATSQNVSGNLTFEGNVTFLGNVTTISANNLVIQDNFIYLNDGNNLNAIDFGFVGNYYDGTYKHAGFFRDATDGVWKVFDNYIPEPDAAVDIDTANVTYREASFKANVHYGQRLDLTNIDGNSIVATGNIFTSRNVIATAFRTSAGDVVWHAGNDGAGSGLDADLLDGQSGSYYLDWTNQTNKPAINLSFTGDVTGSGGVVLTNSGTNSLSVALTVAADSVALGTDTTGNYVNRVVGGTGISATGTADEGNVITVGLTNTGVSAATYGNATTIPIVTIDAQGRVTSASNTNIIYDGLGNRPAANIILSGDATGTANAVLTANSTVLSLAATLASTGVVATTYGNATIVPVITVDAKGRITSASNVTISASGGGAALTSPANNFIVIAGTCSITSTGCNNIIIGSNAGACTTFGKYNFFAGFCAGFSNSTGQNNNFFGNGAGLCNTTGTYNNFLGFRAGRTNSTGCYNNFFGFCAGFSNTTGRNNTFFGRGAGRTNSSGAYNNFFGYYAGLNNTTGNHNTFFGCSAGFSNLTGQNNNFFGQGAGACNITGNLNIYLGLTSGGNITAGNNNIIFGNVATNIGFTDGTSNVIIFATGGNRRIDLANTANLFIGTNANVVFTSSALTINGTAVGGGATLTSPANNFIVIAGTCSITATGCNNIFIGANAGACTTFGCHNFFAGQCAGFSNSTGSNNNFAGQCAGFSNTSGADNNFAGFCAGFCNSTGKYNNFFGRNAGRANSTGRDNNFFGQCAGFCNTTGNYNNFFGQCTGACNTTGRNNNFFGRYAGRTNSTGNYNIFFGFYAGGNNTTGTFNNFFGRNAGCNNTTGSFNNFFGRCAGCCNTTGNLNIYIGYTAGGNITTGNDNIIFGNLVANAGLTDSTSNVIIFATGGIVRQKIESIGTSNSFYFGECAGSNNAGGNNFFAGRCAGFCNTSGGNNIYMGNLAGYNNTTGDYNIFFGASTGTANTTGIANNFFGRSSGSQNTTGSNNNFLGRYSGGSNTTGSNNIFIGFRSGNLNTFGAYNIFLGLCSGRNLTTGRRNLIFGQCSGANVTTGNDNLMLGHIASCAGFTDATSNVIIISTGSIERIKMSDGNLSILGGTGNVFANSYVVNNLIQRTSSNATLASTTETNIFTFSANVYASAKFIISAQANNERQVSELLVLHDNTTAISTEYAVLRSGNILFSSNVGITGSNVTLSVTGNTATSTRYIVSGTLISQ